MEADRYGARRVLAIHHIRSFLTIFVPGFACISPAIAERLIVTALKVCGRSGEERVGGLSGDVIYEKPQVGNVECSKEGKYPLSVPTDEQGSSTGRSSSS